MTDTPSPRRRGLVLALGALGVALGGLLTAAGVVTLVAAFSEPASRAYYLTFAIVALTPGLAGLAGGGWLVYTGVRGPR